MSDRMTSIQPKYGQNARPEPWPIGIENYGRKTRTEMLTAWREHYEHQKQQAELALDLADDELVVHTFLGSFAQRNKVEVTE